MEKTKEVKDARRILVALDLGHMDDLLLQYAQFLYNSLESVEEIILFHNICFDYPEEADSLLSSLDRPLTDILQKRIEEKAKKYIPEAPFEVLIKENDNTADAVVETIRKKAVDLTLFGKKVTYDGSGYLVERAFYHRIGSHVMVLPETAYHRVDRMLVPIDFSKTGANTLRQSMDLSETVGAEVFCQYVYAVPNIYFPYIPVKDLKSQMSESSEKKWKSFIKKYFEGRKVPFIEYSFHAERSVSQVIYDYSLQHQIDLVVLPLQVGFTNNTVVQLLKIDMHIPLLIIE